MKWWLISDKDVAMIRDGLSAPTHTANDYNCGSEPHDEVCKGCYGNDLRKVAMMALDTGLHKTEDVPRDFRFCPGCREFKPDDERVASGMKCGQCAY